MKGFDNKFYSIPSSGWFCTTPSGSLGTNWNKASLPYWAIILWKLGKTMVHLQLKWNLHYYLNKWRRPNGFAQFRPWFQNIFYFSNNALIPQVVLVKLPVEYLESPLGHSQSLRPRRDVVGVLLPKLGHLGEGEWRDFHQDLELIIRFFKDWPGRGKPGIWVLNYFRL